MKKVACILLSSLLLLGCATTEKEQTFYEAAAACNKVCESNPSVSQVSSSAGGGLPLLFLGKMETSCLCHR